MTLLRDLNVLLSVVEELDRQDKLSRRSVTLSSEPCSRGRDAPIRWSGRTVLIGRVGSFRAFERRVHSSAPKTSIGSVTVPEVGLASECKRLQQSEQRGRKDVIEMEA